MTKEEALRKVLVTLEWFEERKHLNQFDWQTQHIADIKEALAQEQQSWVSLTKEEIDSALSKYQNWYEFAAHLENILKEKNQ